MPRRLLARRGLFCWTSTRKWPPVHYIVWCLYTFLYNSTGLDSATAFDITLTLKKWARRTKGTVLAATLQPTPEVFELYDNIIMLKDGHVVYNGPRPAAVPYLKWAFNVNVPSTRDYADFLFEFLVDPQVGMGVLCMSVLL